MDAAAGGGIDQLRVSDMQKSDINPVSYQTNTTTTSKAPPPWPSAQFPKINPPYRTAGSVDPTRWGLQVDEAGNIIVPNPKPPGWDRALQEYFNARQIYLKYKELNKDKE